MSFFFAVWPTSPRRSSSEAKVFYERLYVGDYSGINASPHIVAFYQELTARHPEIDDATQDELNSPDQCPWDCAMHWSAGHIILTCMSSKAEYVGQLLEDLAQKHNLAIYDPLSGCVKYPDDVSPIAYIWRCPRPTVTGSWLAYSSEERMTWLDRVRMYMCFDCSAAPDRHLGVVEIDGLLIDDYPSFFLALGEAINGPAGYFGGDLDALDDCLCGGFGIEVPFTLIWRNHQFSKEHLAASGWSSGNLKKGENLWTVIVDIFASRGTTLKLL